VGANCELDCTVFGNRSHRVDAFDILSLTQDGVVPFYIVGLYRSGVDRLPLGSGQRAGQPVSKRVIEVDLTSFVRDHSIKLDLVTERCRDEGFVGGEETTLVDELCLAGAVLIHSSLNEAPLVSGVRELRGPGAHPVTNGDTTFRVLKLLTRDVGIDVHRATVRFANFDVAFEAILVSRNYF